MCCIELHGTPFGLQHTDTSILFTSTPQGTGRGRRRGKPASAVHTEHLLLQVL